MIASAVAVTLRPALAAFRAILIKIELRNTDYHLAHIAETRRNDFLVERLLHKRQVHLVSELRRLEGRK